MDDLFEGRATMVIDNGSSTCRGGFAGKDEPFAVFPSLIGRPKHQMVLAYHTKPRVIYYGERAQEQRGLADLTYPVERGIITDFDAMEEMWRNVFYDWHRRCHDSHPILMTEPSMNSKKNRENLTEFMFERFDAFGFALVNHGILTHYASGGGDGIVLNIGDGVCDVVPVIQGRVEFQAVRRVDFAGLDLTEYLMRLLNDKGLSFVTTAERDVVREIKESVGYVAQDVSQEMHLSGSKSPVAMDYQLPDGQVITVHNERFLATEPLFQPSLLGRDHQAVHRLVSDSINACDTDHRDTLYSNIILSGGTTLFRGFPERLQKELASLAPVDTDVKIVASPERINSAWIGGSIISSLSTFRKMWITPEEYKEQGPNIIHQKCLT